MTPCAHCGQAVAAPAVQTPRGWMHAHCARMYAPPQAPPPAMAPQDKQLLKILGGIGIGFVGLMVLGALGSKPAPAPAPAVTAATKPPEPSPAAARAPAAPAPAKPVAAPVPVRRGTGRARCCDGSISPSCQCGGGRGCCSRHGGVCGCDD